MKVIKDIPKPPIEGVLELEYVLKSVVSKISRSHCQPCLRACGSTTAFSAAICMAADMVKPAKFTNVSDSPYELP